MFMSEIMEIGGVALGAMYVILSLWGALVYVLTGVSEQALAKRRGIPNGWLAWLPFGNVWLLGRLSDHYQMTVARRHTKRASTLLTLTILTVIFAVLSGMCLGTSGAYLSGHQLEPGSLIVMILGFMLLFAALALGLAQSITGLVAAHGVYRSSRPAAAACFVVLSIFFPFLKPFFLLSCRNRDDGLHTHVKFL